MKGYSPYKKISVGKTEACLSLSLDFSMYLWSTWYKKRHMIVVTALTATEWKKFSRIWASVWREYDTRQNETINIDRLTVVVKEKYEFNFF